MPSTATILPFHLFTNANTIPEALDMVQLYAELIPPKPLPNIHIRLDLYFLPGANEDDCISHYRGEREARGNYYAQIDAFKNALRENIPPPAAKEGQINGIVPMYTLGNGGVLFIFQCEDWNDDQRALQSVIFDPFKDAIAASNKVEPYHIRRWHPINNNDPVFDHEDRGMVANDWMSDLAIPHGEGLSGPRHTASIKGWVCWPSQVS
ncbi:hypothetical protein BDV36DRAFT_298662 [Aspergillus pseudocaelatus]|uniref:Uncharacterized protein n=1 Tax=Aspergillus pseudocaelatus TaxID=1825620 RepID=A0ABQ6WCH2_9EURO|nr:hypothetical protein BDV36DRAFT_298662 [Aspergillus pseudocaelatus]